MMETGTQVDGKFCLPLPIRNPDKDVPNNRLQAVQRAAWLKRKLIKCPKMFADYKSIFQIKSNLIVCNDDKEVKKVKCQTAKIKKS